MVPRRQVRRDLQAAGVGVEHLQLRARGRRVAPRALRSLRAAMPCAARALEGEGKRTRQGRHAALRVGQGPRAAGSAGLRLRREVQPLLQRARRARRDQRDRASALHRPGASHRPGRLRDVLRAA